LFTINLHNLIFFAHHGIHDEEKILGNEYEVNVSLSFEAADQITALDQTINYVSVYEIIKKRMAIPTALLETLAEDLVQKIYFTDKRIKSISVSIEKKNPPIPNMESSVAVSCIKNF
jgi:dihydroneopterin aldolase